MSMRLLSAVALSSALDLRDLSDPSRGPHAMQLLVDDVVRTLSSEWGSAVRVARSLPIVDTADNYDALHYPRAAVARDALYTRYLNEHVVLRTHTTAMIPGELRRLAQAPEADVLIACPGICYRRDSIDRLHTGEPHQLDLWRVRAGEPLGERDLERMIESVVQALLPGRVHRTSAVTHPYTLHGRQIDVLERADWIEIGECGLALPALLAEQGLDPARHSGLAMGIGLDRALMLRKGIDDIRVLRASDPRIAEQLLDLSPYRPVSRQPAVRRDLSIVVDADDSPELYGDRVRAALGDGADQVESVSVLSETHYRALPPAAIARLGIEEHQKNVLVRVVLRRLDRALTHPEANRLRNAIYAALHQGSRSEWAG
jgi:phenylalanyl-tRNA synthetase alpha chain